MLTVQDLLTLGVRVIQCAKCEKVEVIRCHECRKYDLETQRCKFWPDEGYRHPDHFCAEGKRRDDHETDCHEAD